MIHRVDSTTYELVRQPYMKYTPKKYYTICIALYLINLVFACVVIFGPQGDSIFRMTAVNELFLLWKSPIQAIFKFLLPGLLFYQACIKFSKE